jgi:hypothetical protein
MKMPSNPAGKVLPRDKSSGFAIVLTLIVIVMMTVLVIGFNAATRTEQMAARNYSYQEQAHLMAMLAVNKGVELLNSAMTNPRVITQPGRYFSTNSGVNPLTSEFFITNGPMTNINAWQIKEGESANHTNYFISTNTNPASLFSVPLFTVMATNAAGGATTPIGQYGFWIDDDGTRLNLNAAAPSGRTSFLPTNARPLLLTNKIFGGFDSKPRASFASWVQPANVKDASNGWGWFFTPRQICSLSNFGEITYHNMLFYIGAGPLNVRDYESTTNNSTNLSPGYALSADGLPAALDSSSGLLATYGSSNYSASLSGLTSALDAAAGKFFKGTPYASYFGDSNGFAAKYGTNVLRQIIANINDATNAGGNGTFTGANTTDMLATNGGGTNPVIPSTVLGLRPAIFLNEVAVGVAYATKGTTTDTNGEVQIWMQSEMVDPYRTGLGGTYEVVYGLKSISFRGKYTDTNGSTNDFVNSQLSMTSPVRVGVATNLDGMGQKFLNNPKWFHVPDKAYCFEWQLGTNTVPPLPKGASNIVISSMTVQPSYVVIRARGGFPTTVRDWAAFEDFPTNGFQFSSVPLGPKAYGTNTLGSGQYVAPPNVFTQSIEKNDPRVRRFGTNTLDSPAWTNVSTPTLQVFRPPADKDTGASVLVCPGGGYSILALDLEGDVA